jgi:hypothetical protein
MTDTDGSEDVNDFLRRIKELGDKRDREDEGPFTTNPHCSFTPLTIKQSGHESLRRRFFKDERSDKHDEQVCGLERICS